MGAPKIEGFEGILFGSYPITLKVVPADKNRFQI